MQVKAAQIDGLPSGGGSGTRGGVFHKVTTNPSSYTTQYGGFTPSYRIAVSTVTSQGGHSDVIEGDVVWYSYYFYPVGRVGGGYAYLGARLSMRGATGATGSTGPSGPAGVRGSLWYAGTAISGTSVNNSVISGSGIASANVGDMYLNTGTGEVFACVLKGAPSVARWTYQMTLQGGSGGGVRGSLWYAGTAISGTSVNNSVISGSGIASALVGDMYLNTGTGEVFACVLNGAPSVARWTYQMTLQGGSGGGGGGGTCNMPPAASFVARLITSAVEVGTPTGAAAALSVGEYPLGTAVASHNFYTLDYADLGTHDFDIYVSPMPTPNVRQRCVFLNTGSVDLNIHFNNSDTSMHTLITEYRNGYNLRVDEAVEMNFITVDSRLEEAKENVYGEGKGFDFSLVHGSITTCTIECDDFGVVKDKK